MKTISKSAIAPIVTALFLAISYVTGHKFDNSIQDEVSTIVAAVATLGITIWGIFKDHTKPTVKTVPAEIKAVETAANTVLHTEAQNSPVTNEQIVVQAASADNTEQQ